jgi:hypothetical protein
MTTATRWIPRWGKGLLVLSVPIITGIYAAAVVACEPRVWVIVLAGIATGSATVAALDCSEPWPACTLLALAGEVLLATDDASRVRSSLIVVFGAPLLLVVHSMLALLASLLPGALLELRALKLFAWRVVRVGGFGAVLAPALLAASWLGPSVAILGAGAVVVIGLVVALLLRPQFFEITRQLR